jgi:hypothetical protein
MISIFLAWMPFSSFSSSYRTAKPIPKWPNSSLRMLFRLKRSSWPSVGLMNPYPPSRKSFAIVAMLLFPGILLRFLRGFFRQSSSWRCATLTTPCVLLVSYLQANFFLILDSVGKNMTLNYPLWLAAQSICLWPPKPPFCLQSTSPDSLLRLNLSLLGLLL